MTIEQRTPIQATSQHQPKNLNYSEVRKSNQNTIKAVISMTVILILIKEAEKESCIIAAS